MLKTVLLKVFLESVNIFSPGFFENSKEHNLFKIEIFCNIMDLYCHF